jgi:hypothetical protein
LQPAADAWHLAAVGTLFFAHRGMLAALGLAGLPLLVYWWGRRHVQVMPFAAAHFVRFSALQPSPWERLRLWAVLGLRTLGLAALVLALARPEPPPPPPASKAPVAAPPPAAAAAAPTPSRPPARRDGPVRLLAVNGDRRATAEADELYFVDKAVRQVPAEDAPIAWEAIEPAALDAAALGRADVVLLAQAPPLGAAALQALRVFVEGGGGLLVSLGDQVQFEAANQQLGRLLAAPLRDQRLVCDLAAGAVPVGLEVVVPEHPALRPLGTGWATALRSTRTCRYFNVETDSARLARTLMRFDDGAPALLEAHRPTGGGNTRRGPVMLWTTSIDRDDTDLPLRSAYVPLVQQLIRYLADPTLPAEGARKPSPRSATPASIQAPELTAAAMARQAVARRWAWAGRLLCLAAGAFVLESLLVGRWRWRR